MSVKLTIAPTEEPVSLQEAKDYLRVDGVEEDDLVASLVTSARQRVEAALRRALVTQTWRWRADGFPRSMGDCRWMVGGRIVGRDAITLQVPPLISVSSIIYIDNAGNSQTMSPSDYVQDTDSEPGQITRAYGVSWPSTRSVPSAVTVTFVAGYGAAAAVPDGIKTAIKMLASHWYTNRGPVITGTIAAELPITVRALLDPFRWGSYV